MEAPVPAAAPEKSPVALEIGAVVLLFLDVILSFLIASAKHLQGVELGTYALGPVIFLLIVLGIARMMGKAKTRRSRAVIAVVFLLIVFMSNLSGLNRLSERQQSAGPAGAEELLA
jgi:phosphatidylglycerophosphate synthase